MDFLGLKFFLLLPFLFLGWVLARLFSTNRFFPWAPSMVWALAVATVLPMLAGTTGENFADTVFISSGLALALGLIGLILSEFQVRFFGGTEREPFPWLFLLLTGLSAALVGLVGFHVSIHDETSIQSHPAVIERILRDGLPVGLIAFPDVPLKYHYGFNVLTAVFAYCLNLPGWKAIDVLNIFLWIVTCFSLGSLLRTLGLSSKLRAVALLWILMGAGWMWWERPDVWQHSYYYGRHMKPMLLSWFFQHPVALGLPLFFLGLEYWIQFRAKDRLYFFAASVILTGILSFAQVVLFGGLFAGIGIDLLKECWKQRSAFFPPFLRGLVFLVVSLGLAYLLGGFFSFHPAYQGDLTVLSWPPGFLKNEYFSRSPLDWKQTAEWYLLNFGAPLILFPIAICLAWRRRLSSLTVPLVIATLGFLIPQFIQYKLSWDVMKFFLLFDLVARLIIAVVFLPVLEDKVWRWSLAFLILFTSLVDPFAFLVKFGFTPPEKFPFFARELIGSSHAGLTKEYARLLGKLRETSPSGYILANSGLSRLVSVYTGLPVLDYDRNTIAFGLQAALQQARREQILNFWGTLSYRSLKAAEVRWVLWPCEDDPRFSPEARASMAAEISSGAFGSYVFSDSPKTCVRALEVKAKP
jgi:hypothetical protein